MGMTDNFIFLNGDSFGGSHTKTSTIRCLKYFRPVINPSLCKLTLTLFAIQTKFLSSA